MAEEGSLETLEELVREESDAETGLEGSMRGEDLSRTRRAYSCDLE